MPMTSSTDEQPITPTLARSAMGLLVGMVISVLLSAALVYSAAKAGITPGVSPLVVLFGWVVFGSFMRGKLKGFLAIAQVTGSAGAAVTAGVVFTAPIIQIVYSEAGLPIPPVDVMTLIIASIAGSLMGFGFVGLGTKRFLSDPRLPAPEAVAADRLISTAVANPDARPKLSISLLPGLLGGFLVNAFLELKYLAHDAFHATIGAPWDMKDPDGNVQADTTSQVELPLPVSPLYLGIGALLTLPTALLIFAGGLVNASTTSYAGAEGMPDPTFRWVGGAAMTIAVMYSLLAYVLEGRKRSANATQSATAPVNDPLLEQSPYFVGQRLQITSTKTGGAAATVERIVTGITQSSADSTLTLTFDQSIDSLTGTQTLGTNKVFRYATPPAAAFSIDYAQLVLHKVANAGKIPNLVLALRGVLTHAPNSAPPERVFSILNDCFDDDQLSALDDYVQLSLMLQYNARGRSRGA